MSLILIGWYDWEGFTLVEFAVAAAGADRVSVDAGVADELLAVAAGTAASCADRVFAVVAAAFNLWYFHALFLVLLCVELACVAAIRTGLIHDTLYRAGQG